MREIKMNNMQNFETFLEEKYDEINSNSNNMNEEFEGARDSWFENLDGQEYIDYAEEWMAETLKGLEPIIKDHITK